MYLRAALTVAAVIAVVAVAEPIPGKYYEERR